MSSDSAKGLDIARRRINYSKHRCIVLDGQFQPWISFVVEVVVELWSI